MKSKTGVYLGNYLTYYEDYKAEPASKSTKLVHTSDITRSFTRRITRLRNAALASRSAK